MKWLVRDLFTTQIRKTTITDMNKKLLLTDLDDTLLTSKKEVSATDRNSIEKMITAGHKFAIATGRPFFSARLIAQELELCKPGVFIIASNGGAIYDCGRDLMLHKGSVPLGLVEYMFGEAAKSQLHIHTYTDTHVVCLKETPELLMYTKTIKMPYKILEKIPEDLPYEPPKMIVMSIKDNSREILTEFKDRIYPSIEGKLNPVFSNKSLLEFLPPDSSKGAALVKLCNSLGIPVADSIACGDEENDISMIKAAGVGVAMKNGTDSARACADYITTCTNNENAITEAINKFVF